MLVCSTKKDELDIMFSVRFHSQLLSTWYFLWWNNAHDGPRNVSNMISITFCSWLIALNMLLDIQSKRMMPYHRGWLCLTLLELYYYLHTALKQLHITLSWRVWSQGRHYKRKLEKPLVCFGHVKLSAKALVIPLALQLCRNMNKLCKVEVWSIRQYYCGDRKGISSLRSTILCTVREEN